MDCDKHPVHLELLGCSPVVKRSVGRHHRPRDYPRLKLKSHFNEAPAGLEIDDKHAFGRSYLGHALIAVLAWLVCLSPAHAQTFSVQHPPIPLTTAIPQSAILPSRPTAPTPPVRPTKALISQPPGANCVAAGGGQPAPIVALVAALKCDPDLIFEYVYNNIEFEPSYGSNKGALGTLLDQRGGDADQSILLATLLNVAGYSDVQFAWGVIQLTGAQLSSWLGVTNDATAVQALLNAGGFPTANFTANPDGTLNYIDIGHFDVVLELGGTWYLFDPSYKQHTLISGAANLAAILGYARTQLLGDTGGTIDSVSISSVNRAALRGNVTQYAGNLIDYINQNNRALSIGNIIGGKSIQPLTGSPLRLTSFPNLSPAFGFYLQYTTFPTYCPQQSPSIECRTYVTVTMPGASSGQAIKLYTDQIYGHRITVFSVPSGANCVPTLLIDGGAPACVSQGACTNVGPATAAGQTWSINSQVTQPNQLADASCGSGITACKALTVAAGGSYLINVGVGQVGRGMQEYHRQLLAQARAAGNPDTSERVLGENLAVIGYAWLAECSAEQRMTDQFAQTTSIYHFAVGIVAQANIQQSSYQGPYVDLPVNNIGIQPQLSNGPTTTIGSYTYPTAFVAAAFAFAEAESAFEAAVLMQTQASVPGMTAASSVNIIDNNMNPSYSGALQKTFFADGTTSAGRSAYTSTIKPAITPYYGSSDLSAITGLVTTTNAQVLIPENGQVAVGSWTGAGYTEILPQANAITFSQKITGGLTGGFSGTVVANPAPNTQASLPLGAGNGTVPGILNPPSNSANPQVAEPLDGITGAYVYEHRDLVTGSGPFPYALPLSRIYLSSSGSLLTTTTADRGVGNGWGHTYSFSAQVDSDPYISMGASDVSALNAATSIAALYVMQDLLSVTPSAQTVTVSSMIARWLADQVTGNVVMVKQPRTTEEFVALPHSDDATAIAYNPPPGSSVQFSQIETGQYVYARKDGVRLNFGPTPAGALQSWIFPNGMSINLTYSGSGQLVRVANNIGRSLSFAYAGGSSDVTSLADDSGRTVAYAYDGNHNLVSYTDPNNAITAFAYDSSGTYDTFGSFDPSVLSFPGRQSIYHQLVRLSWPGHPASQRQRLYLEFLFCRLTQRDRRCRRQPPRHLSDRPRQGAVGRLGAERNVWRCVQRHRAAKRRGQCHNKSV